jgi:hypothetical protein
MTDDGKPEGSATPAPRKPPAFEFVVQLTAAGWTVSGRDGGFGPFHSRERAVDLAEGMAHALRQVGETAAVRVVPPGRRAGDPGPSD